MSTASNKYCTSKFINKKNITLKNYYYLVEVINNLTLLIPDRVLKVEITESNDKLQIIEENEQTQGYSFYNCCKYDKDKILKKIMELFILLSQIFSKNIISLTKSNFLIINNENIVIYDWYDKLLINEEINQSKFYYSISTLLYSIIEENPKEVCKSIYEMVKNPYNELKLSEENKIYENLLNKIILNKILLEEIELELENEYETDYVEIKETELKELNFYYGSYHPIESIVKNWIDIEIKNIVNNKSEQIILWNCIVFSNIY